jgi:hypothetical protein
MVINSSRILIVVCALGAIALAVLFVLKVVFKTF